jgi:serine/threonine-protein kinase
MAEDPASKVSRRAVRIGKYEVLTHIATGGMGAVYKARDTETGREVALKVLMPETAAKPAFLERFRREARSAGKLCHENIVALYEYAEWHGTHFIALEFVDGTDLHDYVSQNGPLRPDLGLSVVMQGCRALQHAHDNSIIHRDVKPSNFLVTFRDGHIVVKLTDLGLAREVENDEFRLTRLGTTVGTIDYIAPEQARDSGLADGRSDLYSLGATWFFLLTGRAPFPKGGLGERVLRLLTEEAPDVRSVNKSVPAETAAVIRRLLAKDPADRYQTPTELLHELEALQRGRRVAAVEEPPREADYLTAPPTQRHRQPSGPQTPRPATASVAADDTGVTAAPRPPSATRPAAKRPRRQRRRDRISLLIVFGILAVVAAAVLGTTFYLITHKRQPTPAGEPVVIDRPPPPPRIPMPALPPQGKKPPPRLILDDPPPPPKPAPAADPPAPPPPAPARTTWRTLYTPSRPLDVAAFRKELEAPWQGQARVAGEPVVRTVGRAAAGAYASLSAACADVPAGQPLILEIRDNGPLFDVCTAVAGRDVTIRAAKGYRPLLLWDVPRTLEERRRAGTAETEPLTFLYLRGGRLTLEGLNVAVRWPEASAPAPAAVLEVRDGDLTVTNCTFSSAGSGGLAAVRFVGAGLERSRCRLTRCFVRGEGTALDLDAPQAEVLFDGCLLVGGDRPLLRVRAGDQRPATVRAVRSTLVAGRTFLRLDPAAASDRHPALNWIGWDVLISRSGASGQGDLLRLPGEVRTDGVKWRAVNCLYAGWQNLLAADTTIPATELRAWRWQWDRSEGDEVAAGPWPSGVGDVGVRGAAAYTLTQDLPVAAAASAVPDQPLGCDTAALPAGRDNWLSFCGQPYVLAPAEAPGEAAPAIPLPLGDQRYHGERLDLARITDLGDHLKRMQQSRGLGPRVVLQLSGTGIYTMTPVRLSGRTLVLHLTPSAARDQPLILMPAPRATGEALFDVEDGNLEITGGILRMTDQTGGQPFPWLLRVRGGDLRLSACRLEGPHGTAGGKFRGLVSCAASGKTHQFCLLQRTVLVSGGDGIHLEGGVRLGAWQSLLVAGGAALDVRSASGRSGKVTVQCRLERTTVAAREAVVRLGEAGAGLAEPAVVVTQDCAFLNPFMGRSRPGLLLYQGDALAHGGLLWQSESDLYDRRLYFNAGRAPPDKQEPLTVWPQLWGLANVRKQVIEERLQRVFEVHPWGLERLTLPRNRAGHGADLAGLGIAKKPA